MQRQTLVEKTPKTPKTLFDRIETKEEEANTTIGIEKHFGREKDTCEFYVYILHVGIKRCFVNFVFSRWSLSDYLWVSMNHKEMLSCS